MDMEEDAEILATLLKHIPTSEAPILPDFF
jgi:hypothetical protein